MFRGSSEDIERALAGSRSLCKIKAQLCFSELREDSGDIREVQISLDFIGGQRSIVTFRFSAGDTMMRRRIYASRGM